MVARLAQKAQWHISLNQIPWLQFENVSIRPFYLPGLLWHTMVRPRDTGTLNSIVSKTQHLWSLYHQILKLYFPRPPLSSFLGDRRFPLAFGSPKNFLWWESNSLTTLNSLTQSSQFCSYSYLQQQFDIPRIEFFKYLQVRHFYKSLYSKIHKVWIHLL